MSSTSSTKNQPKASRRRSVTSTSSASASKLRVRQPKLKTYKVDGVLVTESSGNLWRDASFPDAEERQAKTGLAIAIRRRIEALGLTPSAAARRLGIHQPRMSEIWNNHVDGYTIDKLSGLLLRLGATLQITVAFSEKQGGYQVFAP